jgi:membrane protease subunit (stomatin/prohibitin family)
MIENPGQQDGEVRLIRGRDVEGVFHFNLDDYISVIQTAIDKNEKYPQLQQELRTIKMFLLKLATEIDQQAITIYREYADEKLVCLDVMAKSLHEEIERLGPTGVQAGANAICLDILLQLDETRGNAFSDN